MMRRRWRIISRALAYKEEIIALKKLVVKMDEEWTSSKVIPVKSDGWIGAHRAEEEPGNGPENPATGMARTKTGLVNGRKERKSSKDKWRQTNRARKVRCPKGPSTKKQWLDSYRVNPLNKED
jgi:hypothetical protein